MKGWIVVPRSGNGKKTDEQIRVYEERVKAQFRSMELARKGTSSFTMVGFLVGPG